MNTQSFAGALASLLLLCGGANAQFVVSTIQPGDILGPGFTFGGFNSFGAVFDSPAENTIFIDANEFGGLGLDGGGDFDAAAGEIQVALTVTPNNVASGFNIVLIDEDGVDDMGMRAAEEFQFFFSLEGVTPGVPTILTQSLISPANVQTAFGASPGDAVQNFGLSQVQLQSQFGSTDLLSIELQSISVVDTDNPLIAELTTESFDLAVQSFTFGTFGGGAADASGDAFVINGANPGGGIGFNGISGIDFDAENAQLEVEARLLPGNTAENFRVLLGDSDGDDTAPGEGSEDFLFNIPTAEFNEETFTTLTIPLGSGSESELFTTFGFTNGGDGLQNFGLSQIQIQAEGAPDEEPPGGPSVLNIEILRASIVAIEQLAGDFNGDGIVSAADFTVWRDSLGQTGAGLAADANGDEVIDIADYNIFVANFGSGEPIVSELAAVPEPASLVLIATVGALAGVRRRVAHCDC